MIALNSDTRKEKVSNPLLKDVGRETRKCKENKTQKVEEILMQK